MKYVYYRGFYISNSNGKWECLKKSFTYLSQAKLAVWKAYKYLEKSIKK